MMISIKSELKIHIFPGQIQDSWLEVCNNLSIYVFKVKQSLPNGILSNRSFSPFQTHYIFPYNVSLNIFFNKGKKNCTTDAGFLKSIKTIQIYEKVE